MKTAVLLAALLGMISFRASAETMDHSMHGMAMPSEHDMGDMAPTTMPKADESEKVGQEPPPAPPADFAAERFYSATEMEAARAQLREEHGGNVTSKTIVNLAEFQVRDGENGYRWDGEFWYGGDINRFVAKSEGEGSVNSGLSSGEVQALYSRAIDPYFDLQAGVRQDIKPTPVRTYATIGLEGLAPYWFETNGAFFLSNRGELLGRLEGTYDLNLTQRLILQPRAEINLSAQNISQTGIGAGVSNVELGLRLRYELQREFAPYIGISYDNEIGKTADYTRQQGEEPRRVSFVIGIHSFF
ncbi:MAG: copper resistance protein B [Alphaproteobacteria bacterium]